jgi:hypothetical protein
VRTFEDVLKYLPLCEAFQDAFALDATGRWVSTKPLYYIVDNDGEIYYTRCVCPHIFVSIFSLTLPHSEAAKKGCQRQPDYGVICVMTSERDTQARRDGWPDDY